MNKSLQSLRGKYYCKKSYVTVMSILHRTPCWEMDQTGGAWTEALWWWVGGLTKSCLPALPAPHRLPACCWLCCTWSDTCTINRVNGLMWWKPKHYLCSHLAVTDRKSYLGWKSWLGAGEGVGLELLIMMREARNRKSSNSCWISDGPTGKSHGSSSHIDLLP